MSLEQSFPASGHVYDLVVIGAGISGCECVWAAARAGLDCLLVTTSLDSIYKLFGDGGELAAIPDSLMASCLAKHPTPSSWDCHSWAKYALEHQARIHLLQSSASSLRVESGRAIGLETWEGVPRYGKHIVLAVGSFLNAELSIGIAREKAGRLSEMSYDDLYHNLISLGLSFDELEHEVTTSPSYHLRCSHLSPEHLDGHRIKEIERLYALGYCAKPDIRYPQAAQAGQELARQIVSLEGR